MLRWAFIFLVVAIVAGILGFGGIAGAATDMSKLLFFGAIAVFLVMAVLGATVFKKIT